MRVQGRLHVERVAVEAVGQVVVRVEDVGRADSSARILARAELGVVHLVPGRPVDLAFDLRVHRPADPSTCAIAAHVDTTGTGDVSVGDYITMQHVGLPIDTDQEVVVPLRRVGGDVA